MQSFNLDGTRYFFRVRFQNPSLAIPHFSVQDISKIDPDFLKWQGFKGLVFDKDNTLTAPYADEIYKTIEAAFEHYQSIFGRNIVIMSNSAGTLDDKGYAKALKIEHNLGITVIRHDKKKPGGIEAVMQYFNDCRPDELVAFGDRILTDIVFGNMHGLLTVHTKVLDTRNDNKVAAVVREYELRLVNKLRRAGVTAPYHALYEPGICIQ